MPCACVRAGVCVVFWLHGSVRHHNIGHAHKSEDVGPGEQISAGIEFCGRMLDVFKDAGYVLGQHGIGGIGSERMHNGTAGQSEIVRSVEQSAFLEDFASAHGHGRVSTFDDALASVIGETVYRGFVDDFHGAAWETQIARYVEQIIGMIELGRGGRDNVPSE